MKEMRRKVIGVILALAMVFTVLPLNKIVASAAPAPTPLTFTAQVANSSVTFNWVFGSGVEYSTDSGSTWSTYSADTTITLPNVGDTVSFRGTNVQTGPSRHFAMTGKIAASGDVTSLTNGSGGDATLFLDCYSYMFWVCTSLTSAPALPATTLANSCYTCMFAGCESLTDAPALPATNLAQGCYTSMFEGCTGLTTAPALPATILVNNCYNFMFAGCTSLISVPALSATTLAANCYDRMFYGCTSLIVTETTDASEATWIFPVSGASDWNFLMLEGLTAPGTLTAVEGGKMYKVSYVLPAGDYNKVLSETAAKMEVLAKKLAAGEKVEDATVYLTVGDSLPLAIMKTLKKCPGVTLDFKCTYRGEDLHFAIKGGADLVIDENIPWYGPLYLKSVYGVAGDGKQNGANTYLIKYGDTLNGISRRLDVSIAELLKKNPKITNPDRIWAGQVLNY